jgi:hypothetical protein
MAHWFLSFALLAAAAVGVSAACECLPDCAFVPYGREATDIRDFGVLGHCPIYGEVVCCDRSKKFHLDPYRIGAPKGSGSVGCVVASECRIKYGVSVYDIQQHGVLGHCPNAREVR